MSRNLLFEAKEVLKDQQRIRETVIKTIDTLAAYEDVLLKPSYKKGPKKTYYYCKKPGRSRRKYLGGDSNQHVRSIKSLWHAKKALSVIECNIQLLENLINNYVAPDYARINSELPKTYQTSIVESSTATRKLVVDSNLPGYYVSLPLEAVDWKIRMEKEKAKYPPYKPEQLINPALDGTMMRSKSEVIIANIMLLAGIPFVYELPLKIDGEMILPDFTILSMIDFKTVIIIEHQGMMYIDNYAWKHIHSSRTYLKSDLIPNKNLFFTYDSVNKTLDPRQVESILVKFVKPSLDISQLRFDPSG